jgi:hypothetical protein
MEGLVFKGNSSIKTNHKTRRIRWNVVVSKLNKTVHVKATALVDNSKMSLDADIIPHGKNVNIEGFKTINGKKTPIFLKNVDVKKLSSGFI